MKQSNRPVRGTYDLLPEGAERLRLFLGCAGEIMARAGFREIATPLLEEASLFSRSSGDASDIVSKEMYRVTGTAAAGGAKEHHLVLRPEGTAPLVRAWLDNFRGTAGPGRFYYCGPMFRYSRPQKGRYRQFLQLGAEIFGAAGAAADAECLALLMAVLAAAPCPAPEVLVNTLGCPECRAAYRPRLAAFLSGGEAALCADCRRRAAVNPLRALDCKNPGCRPLLDRAPAIGDRLCAGCRDEFDDFLFFCRSLGLAPQVDGRLVRGLDYYTRIVFEVNTADGLAVAAGGRYDGLVAEMGGPPTPALGFGIGLERLLAGAPPAAPPPAGVRLACLDEPGERRVIAESLRLAAALRRRLAVPVTMPERPGRKLGRQLEAAVRDGCRFAVIVGTREIAAGAVTLRDLAAGTQEEVATADLAGVLAERLNGR